MQDHDNTPEVQADGSSIICQPVEPHFPQDLWRNFQNEFMEILDEKSSTSISIFAFLRRNLAVFHLENYMSEAYVLNEVYVRAHNTIHSKKEKITNPIAWTKAAAYNILREQSRKQKKLTIFDETSEAEFEDDNSSAINLPEELETMHLAFEMLTDDDQLLLRLKIVEERSWNEIRSLLFLEQGADLSEAALRKRKERALMRLRKNYHSLRPQPKQENI